MEERMNDTKDIDNKMMGEERKICRYDKRINTCGDDSKCIKKMNPMEDGF